MNTVIFQDLGIVDYKNAWDYQQKLHDEVKAYKLAMRKQGITSYQQNHYLLFCEHPPVFTLGKSGSMDHLLIGENEMDQHGFQFYKINRGGDITYHGPGQLVGYLIFDMEFFFTDVHKLVRNIEEAIIKTCQEFGVTAQREEGFTGVWLPASDTRPLRKICAIGVHLSRWVTLHGFAFNINTDLNHFNHIIPCGIAAENKTVTSLQKELNRPISVEDVKFKLRKNLAAVFNFYEKELVET